MTRSRKPDGTADIQIELGREERDFLLSARCVPPHIGRRIRFAPVEGPGPVFRFTRMELMDLFDALASSPPSFTTKPKKELTVRLMDRIADHLSHGLPGLAGESRSTRDQAFEAVIRKLEAEGFPRQALPPPEVLTMLAAEYRNEKILDPEGFARYIAGFSKQPHEFLGGLSLLDLSCLLAGDWRDPNGPLWLDEDLPEKDLRGAEIVDNCRLFLCAVLEEGGVRATKMGNLNRRFVDRMVGSLRWESGLSLGVKPGDDVRSEFEWQPLHVLRLLLALAGLLRLNKNVFSATRKAERLLANGEQGRLYALMFRSCFRKFNLAYLDCMPDLDFLQETIPFALYSFRKFGTEWIDSRDLPSTVFLPGLAEFLPEAGRDELTAAMVESRLLRCLDAFGLIEWRSAPAKTPALPGLKVRKSPLFDKFIRFNLI